MKTKAFVAVVGGMFLVGCAGNPATQFASEVVIRPSPAQVNEPGTVRFIVENRWGCDKVVFVANWDGVLARVLVDGATVTKDNAEWMVWEARYALFRGEYVIEPAK